jgi:hypothetical protein
VSETTRAQLEDAIRAHVADEADGDLRLLTDFYLVCASVGEDTRLTHYLHVCSDAGTHVLMGLVDIASRRLDAHFDLNDD